MDIIDHVAFRGERLTLAFQDGEPYVAAKPICEQLGLAWQAQHRKLTAAENGWRYHHMVIPSDGGAQETVGLHLVDLPLWLASISPAKVKPELREALLTYRRECALVLFHHVQSRLLGEAAKAKYFASRARADLLARKPLWTRIATMMGEGWDFNAIWRGVRQPRGRVIEAIDDMQRCGLIEAPPSGMPEWKGYARETRRPQAQADLFDGSAS